MRRAVSRAWQALIVLAWIAYQILVHLHFSGASPGPVHLALMCLPFVVIACWVVARSGNRLFWLAVLCAAGVAVYLLEHQARLGLTAVSGVPHAAAYVFLLWHFGRTLARGKVPIVTRFARQVHGSLQPGVERYTRKLTLAWCVFFAAQLTASALLLAFASPEAWSLLVNVFNFPLLGLMFVGQWAYGMVRHPDYPTASIGQALEAFAKDASLSRGAEAR